MNIQYVFKTLEDGQNLLYSWFSAMHSRIDIIIYCDRKEDYLKSIIEEIEDETQRIEAIGNFYNEASELNKINNEASGHAIQISEELFGMIDRCIYYHKKTKGYFDISIHSQNHVPNLLNDVELNEEETTIYYKKQNIKLNLSGYLKGYALDRIADLLNKYSIDNALINVGNSSIMAVGNHPYGKGWRISDKNDTLETTLFDQCFTTSGNENKERKHIINPITGEYVEGEKEISVITKTGTEGEALSTALMAAPLTMHQGLQEEFNAQLIYNN